VKSSHISRFLYAFVAGAEATVVVGHSRSQVNKQKYRKYRFRDTTIFFYHMNSFIAISEMLQNFLNVLGIIRLLISRTVYLVLHMRCGVTFSLTNNCLDSHRYHEKYLMLNSYLDKGRMREMRDKCMK